MNIIPLITVSVTVIVVQGCSLFDGISYDRYAGVAKISNAERTFVVDWENVKDSKGNKQQILRRCLEAPGPAALLDNSKFEVKLKGGTEKITAAELGLLKTNAESVAKLYEVSSILQYAHAMSYRFCESALNRYITPAEYVNRLDKLMEDSKALLEIQIRKVEAETQKINAEVQLEKAKND